MPAQEPGELEPEEVPLLPGGGIAALGGRAALASLTDAQAASLAMLNMHAARSADAQVRAGGPAQPDDAGGAGAAREAAAVPQRLPVPRKRKGPPTGDGYCKHCHFLVGTWRRRLIEHAGFWERYKGGADCKHPDKQPSTVMVKWCEGSGCLPWDLPDNSIDPWEKTS